MSNSIEPTIPAILNAPKKLILLILLLLINVCAKIFGWVMNKVVMIV